MGKKEEDSRDIFDKALGEALPFAGAAVGGILMNRGNRALAKRMKPSRMSDEEALRRSQIPRGAGTVSGIGLGAMSGNDLKERLRNRRRK